MAVAIGTVTGHSLGLTHFQSRYLASKEANTREFQEGDALSGLGILDGDIITVMRTPDIEEGDLVCTEDEDDEEYFNLGVLSFNTGDDYVALTFPGKQKRSEIRPFLLRFVGRAVQVHRNGKRLAIRFRRPEASGVEADSQGVIEERLAA